MSNFAQFYPSQANQEQSEQKETQQLRESLMQKAQKLKEKMYQQTNYYDYTINNLMNQTLKEIKKHKQQFNQHEQNIIQNDKSEQLKLKKNLLKTELIQNLQKCKNRYKKHITLIKNQRNRIYTDTKNQSTHGQQNVQEMLITAKNRFKKEHLQKRNHSEIINLNNTKRCSENKIHNKTNQVINLRKTPKLYNNLIRINDDLTCILDDPSAFPKLTSEEIREINEFKRNNGQVLGLMSPVASKKYILLSTNSPKKTYYSPYHRFPTQIRQTMNNTQIQTIISQRSVFIPIGKVLRSERKQLQISTAKKNNIATKDGNIVSWNERLSTEIADEIQEIQHHNESKKNVLEKLSKQSLELNILLAKSTPKSMHKKPNRPKFLIQSSNLHPDKISCLKTQKISTQSIFDNIKGTRIVTELAPFVDSSFSKSVAQYQNQELKQQTQIKISEQITGKLSLSDTKVVNEVRKDSVLLKSPVAGKYSKFNVLSRGMIKNNKLRYHVDEAKESHLEINIDNRKKLSRSLNFNIKGIHFNLMNSLKLEKSYKQ